MKKTTIKNKKLIVASLVISAFLTAGFVFAIAFTVNYSVYQESFVYYYDNTSPSTFEELDLYASTASVSIRYNDTPTEHLVRVDVNFLIEGGFVKGTTYTNYYQPINWENSTGASFSLESRPSSFANPSSWFKSERNSIVVTLRTDVKYNIACTAITGDISLNTIVGSCFKEIRLKTTTGSIDAIGTEIALDDGITCETTTGNVLINLENCSIGGNVFGKAVTGSVSFYATNPVFTGDCDMTLITLTGGVSADIIQQVMPGASVLGSFSTTTGSIRVTYADNLSNVGARFTGTYTTGSNTFVGAASGFSSNGNGSGAQFVSNDFDVAESAYICSLSTVTGDITVSASSS
ncbi:MAG: hypothetical protein JW891_11370 [Candidatus Lokiarchaeota archaeon]|nr:hypothetical protein [Candidatus Lokiarchaeota archaeon]